jgi:hypothetical protein
MSIYQSEEAKRQAERLADDLLWGAQAIADFLGVSVNTVYYYIRKNSDKKTAEKDKLPISKLGHKTIVASRKKLARAIAEKLAA